MNRDQTGGASLIASSLVALASVALHPTSHDFIRRSQVAESNLRMVVTHSGLLLSAVLALSGALSLARSRRTGGPLGELGLVAYALAVAAGLVAAGLSLAVPAIATPMVDPLDNAKEGYRLLFRYSGVLIQAFAGLYAFASWGAIALWSAAALRRRGLPRALGLYGLLGAVTFGGLRSVGYLVLTTHGFGLVLVTQGVWFVATGAVLLRSRPGTASPQPPTSTTVLATESSVVESSSTGPRTATL
jgi:hypothetical protein